MDIAVALIFFNRPLTLAKVFEKVKAAQPTKLFLIQDGPRNENDVEKIEECRRIVEKVDWDCEVLKNYSSVNLGCGRRPESGISWVFEHVSEAIILEDDCVPDNSFFGFCKEMLYRYKYDYRVGIISGLNHFGKFDFGGYSYGFSRAAGIWGWATWRDRWEQNDFSLAKIDNIEITKLLYRDIFPKRVAKARINEWRKAQKIISKGECVSFWDYQWSFARNINSWVAIVPKYNQIKNIGLGTESTHAKSSLKSMPPKIVKFFNMETYSLEDTYVYPEFLIVNREYDKKYFDITYPNVFIRAINKMRRILYARQN